ncbi:hypothetical protein VNO78_08438 [Psophocarpus tetragonolobus]|uniref:Uncharacterized protein n=1 Tax=Psophocarpus tetragonolobus TaxID=3891 RepID=A0AAN9SXY9_PSOTE
MAQYTLCMAFVPLFNLGLRLVYIRGRWPSNEQWFDFWGPVPQPASLRTVTVASLRLQDVTGHLQRDVTSWLLQDLTRRLLRVTHADRDLSSVRVYPIAVSLSPPT